jgi:hypothetical protein
VTVRGVPARELHETEGGTIAHRDSVATARVAFVGALRAEQAVAVGEPRAQAARDAGPEKRDGGEETLVVNFQPLAHSVGPILVAAQVVSVRLCELTSAPATARATDKVAVAQPRTAPVQVMVEVQSPDAGSTHASVRVTHGPLGPITVELELCQGRVELHASASNSRAAEALRAGESALREGLAQAGIQLDSMRVTVGRRRAASGTRPSSRRKDEGQQES